MNYQSTPEEIAACRISARQMEEIRDRYWFWWDGNDYACSVGVDEVMQLLTGDAWWMGAKP